MITFCQLFYFKVLFSCAVISSKSKIPSDWWSIFYLSLSSVNDDWSPSLFSPKTCNTPPPPVFIQTPITKDRTITPEFIMSGEEGLVKLWNLSGTNINVPVWIKDTFYMIVTLFSTRVMDRPGTFVAGVKAVVDVWVRVLIGAKRHPFRYVKSQKWRRQRVITRVSHVLDNPTVDIAFLPINQAAGSRMTH